MWLDCLLQCRTSTFLSTTRPLIATPTLRLMVMGPTSVRAPTYHILDTQPDPTIKNQFTNPGPCQATSKSRSSVTEDSSSNAANATCGVADPGVLDADTACAGLAQQVECRSLSFLHDGQV